MHRPYLPARLHHISSTPSPPSFCSASSCLLLAQFSRFSPTFLSPPWLFLEGYFVNLCCLLLLLLLTLVFVSLFLCSSPPHLGCTFHEDDFSIKCPKHEVRKRKPTVYIGPCCLSKWSRLACDQWEQLVSYLSSVMCTPSKG